MKYKNISSKKLFFAFLILWMTATFFGLFEVKDISRVIKLWKLFPFVLVLVTLDYFFTYLKIDEAKGMVSVFAFLKSINRVKIDSITHITKEPHPIFKEISWAIFIHYTNEKGKEKHFEIWPSFKPETMGKFLSELQKLNPQIKFDSGCEEWIMKYGKHG